MGTNSAQGESCLGAGYDRHTLGWGVQNGHSLCGIRGRPRTEKGPELRPQDATLLRDAEWGPMSEEGWHRGILSARLQSFCALDMEKVQFGLSQLCFEWSRQMALLTV